MHDKHNINNPEKPFTGAWEQKKNWSATLHKEGTLLFGMISFGSEVKIYNLFSESQKYSNFFFFFFE